MEYFIDIYDLVLNWDYIPDYLPNYDPKILVLREPSKTKAFSYEHFGDDGWMYVGVLNVLNEW